jgi:hypothetical protein
MIRETGLTQVRRMMDINIANGVDIDAQLVMTGRGCIIGQSGSGKSYLVGVITEELCRLNLPFCLIDTEGEYSRLKDAFQIITVGGSGADLGLSIDLSEIFKRSISEGIPVILNVADELDKQKTAEAALRDIYKIEEEVKKPYLVIIEEADKFAPQAVRQKPNIIEEMSVRGRKRGIGLVVATQRPASISKNVLAQCSYGFIGKLVIDNDIKAVVTLLGERGKAERLAKHRIGEFTSFGIGYEESFTVKQRTMEHGGSTPPIHGGAMSPVRLEGIIKELQKFKFGQSKQPNGKTEQGKAKINVIPARISAEEARSYAIRAERKKFILFGGAAEDVDRVSERFIYIALVQIRMPTGQKDEFEERYIMIDSRLRPVRLERKISFVHGSVDPKVKMSQIDREILSFVASMKKTNFDSIQRRIDRDPLQIDDSLNRLSSAGLMKLKNGNASIVTNRKLLIDKAPEYDEETHDKESVLKAGIEERAIRDYVSLLFPGSFIISLTGVYLPAYEIRLRHGNKVRIFTIDALYGARLS